MCFLKMENTLTTSLLHIFLIDVKYFDVFTHILKINASFAMHLCPLILTYFH